MRPHAAEHIGQGAAWACALAGCALPFEVKSAVFTPGSKALRFVNEPFRRIMDLPWAVGMGTLTSLSAAPARANRVSGNGWPTYMLHATYWPLRRTSCWC